MDELVSDAINKVDLDLRRSLFSNIVLSGGTTLTKGSFVAGVLTRDSSLYAPSFCL